jgi:hypothetical protein
MSGTLKPPPFDDASARDALAHQFQKLGLDFSTLHPTIRTVMEQAVISTGDVRQQVERFIMVARMADQLDLSDEEKRHVLEKAYERYGRAAGLLEPVTPTGAGSAHVSRRDVLGYPLLMRAVEHPARYRGPSDDPGGPPASRPRA